MDLETFVSLLRAVISPDPALRKEAERQIKEGKEKQPAALVSLVLQTVQSHSDEEVRLQAAVLFRSFFRGVIDSEGHVWRQLGDAERTQVKQILLHCLDTEKNKLVRNNICDTISDLASDLIPVDQWNDLGQVLLAMIQSGVPVKQQTGLKILSEIAPVLTEQLAAAAPLVCRIISACMASGQDVNTRVEAFALLVAVVEDMNKRVYKKFLPDAKTRAAPECPSVQLLIIDTLEATLRAGAEDDYALAERMMVSIIQLCEAEQGGGVSLLRPHLSQFCDYLLAVCLIGQGQREAAQAAAASLGSTGALGAEQGPCVAATACATKTSDEETPEGLQNCRKYAIEALLCCVEQKSQVMLRVPNFLNRLLEALLMCMLDIRDSSYAKWLEEGEEEDEQRFFDVGEEGLDRICRAYSSDEDLAVGSRTQAASILLPALFNYVTTFLQRVEWEYRFVALMAISQTIEYVQEDQEEELDYIAKTLMRYLGDGDFRVRFAAAQAIGQMSLDQTPYVQEQFASEMLPLLIARMDDEVPRVQGHACAAFVNFSEEVEKAEMLKVASQVMEKLLTKIRPGTPKTVREHAVTCIAVVAGVLEESFVPYYSAVVPSLLDVITNSTALELRSLRGKAIECISIVGLSVSREQFAEDGKVAMEAMLQIAESTATCEDTKASSCCSQATQHRCMDEEGDAVREYLTEALGRMCRAMGADFLVYLPRILPRLLEVLTVKPKELKAEEAEDDEDMTYVILDSNTSLGLKTSLLEEQSRALDLLCTITTVLQDPLTSASLSSAQFSPGSFLQPLAEAVFPLLTHVLSEDIKQKALETMASLIGTCKQLVLQYARRVAQAQSEGQPQVEEEARRSGTSVKEMLRAMTLRTCGEVFKSLQEEDGDVDSMVAEAAGLNDCLSKAGGEVFTDEEVAQQALNVFSALEKSFERRIDISARKNRQDEEVDEDDMLRLEEEDQQEQTLRSSLLEIVGTLMATHPKEFLRSKASEAAAAFVQQFLREDAPDEDKSVALYVCDDILQHLKEDGLSLWPLFMPRLIQCLLSSDPRVLQAAAYGVQQGALLQQAFQPFVQEAAKNLLTAVNRSQKTRNKVEQAATDNTAAALGDLLRYYGGSMHEEEQRVLLSTWLGNLPLKQDETEGLRMHKFLMEAVLQNNGVVLGQNASNLPRLLQILCAVYRTDFSDSDLNEEIKKLFAQINASGQPAPLAALCQNFTAKEQKKLQKILK
ncbi:UNVERIFIED_CONTAM: HEAT repeat-containing protein [Hammondia hammondi]|eukprot:XP_008889512.1 HEAT repeat-containing protein [Hammondia hammondi]